MYEKYFVDIVKTINTQIQKKWPPLTTGENGIFAWAMKNQPELYAQVTVLGAEVDAFWGEVLPPAPLQRGTMNSPPLEGDKGGGDFEAFKAKVLAWGRVILQIYKKFAEKN